MMDGLLPEYIPNVVKDKDLFYSIENVNQTKPLTDAQWIEAGEEAATIHREVIEYANEPVSNNTLTRLQDDEPDTHLWNSRLDECAKKHNRPPDYLNSNFLITECYMYRRLMSPFLRSKYFRQFDVFAETKRLGFECVLDASTKLIEFTAGIATRIQANESTCEKEFENFIEFALWGNFFDLSGGKGANKANLLEYADEFRLLEERRSKIVVNSTKQLYARLKSLEANDYQITFILDNSGFELLGELCFVEMLYQTGLLDRQKGRVIFHTKLYGWFVSDVTQHDFAWLLDCLRTRIDSPVVQTMAEQWSELVDNKCWLLTSHHYWHTCYGFSEMAELAPDLYAELAKSSLVISCGDLNYRKLVGDILWPPSTPFETALRDFKPTSVLAIRTVKSRPLVGLSDQVRLPKLYWKSGSLAVIQLYEKF